MGWGGGGGGLPCDDDAEDGNLTELPSPCSGMELLEEERIRLRWVATEREVAGNRPPALPTAAGVAATAPLLMARPARALPGYGERGWNRAATGGACPTAGDVALDGMRFAAGVVGCRTAAAAAAAGAAREAVLGRVREGSGEGEGAARRCSGTACGTYVCTVARMQVGS